MAVRVGIHTGLVVIGEMGESVTGPSAWPSARQPMLPPDSRAGSPRYGGYQRQHTPARAGAVSCQALGTPPLKGLDQPLTVYQVSAPVRRRVASRRPPLPA